MEDTAHTYPYHESLFPSLTPPFSESQLAVFLSLGVLYTFPPQWRILLLKWRENSVRHTIVVYLFRPLWGYLSVKSRASLLEGKANP